MRSVAALLLALVVSAGAAEIKTYQPADFVLGQTSFTTSTQNVTATTMWNPTGVAVDPITGKVYVADRNNNRVLRFASTAAMTNGAAAEIALGQLSLTSNFVGGATASSMFHPTGVVCDDVGRLYVADSGYNRVLRFNAPATALTGAAASAVFGQTTMTSSTATIAAAGMNNPTSVAIGTGHLWVADTNNHRVIGFASPASLSNGAAATKVFGQSPASFTTKNAPSPPTASSMNSPEGVAIGADGVLWVADTGNNRAVRFPSVGVLASGSPADAVLGQSFFTTNTTPIGPTDSNMYSPEGVAVDLSGSTATLWLVDRVQYRVLRFDDANNPALVDGSPASAVLGQSNFSSNLGGVSQRTFSFPFGVAVDAANTTSSPVAVWIADAGNNRVLRFNPHEPPPPVVNAPSSIKTKKKSGTVRGTIISELPIVKVSYKGPKGGFKKASGTTNWKFRSKFKAGKTRFTVVAVDSLGQSSAPKTIVVKRKKKK